jgi:predicted thioesterase
VGDTILITATVERILNHELICTYAVKVGERLVAEGKTGQKILKRDKIRLLFSNPPK